MDSIYFCAFYIVESTRVYGVHSDKQCLYTTKSLLTVTDLLAYHSVTDALYIRPTYNFPVTI